MIFHSKNQKIKIEKMVNQRNESQKRVCQIINRVGRRAGHQPEDTENFLHRFWFNLFTQGFSADLKPEPEVKTPFLWPWQRPGYWEKLRQEAIEEDEE